MARVLALLAFVALMTPQSSSGFFCKYPTQRLTGLANLGDRYVRLDLAVRLSGPECEVLIVGGRFRCSRMGVHAFGGRFTAPVRGECPGTMGTILTGSYVPWSSGEPIVDLVIEARLENGAECTISGLSPAVTIGGPIASVLGPLLCKG